MAVATYKSKDIQYMSMLKKAVLKGMKGSLPVEKQYTWEYIRKQVTMDDMQTYAVAQLGKIVRFPTDNFNGKIMVIFLSPPDSRERDILDRMIQALRIPKDNVYVTWLNKTNVDTDDEEQVLTTILNSEIGIIDPKLILTFGLNLNNEFHTVSDFKNSKLMTTYDMDWIFKDDEATTIEDRKRAIWEDVIQLMKHYKS